MDTRKLRPVINAPSWSTFQEYLEGWYNSTNVSIDTCDNPVKIHQLQGERRAIQKLLKLREQVNNAD